MELPKEFIDYTSSLFGEERWKNYLASFEESVPVSVRLNPFKCRPTRPLPPPSPVEREPECSKDSLFKGDIYDFIGDDCDRIGSLSTGEGVGRGRITPVPWCRNAYYLSERPNFTLDPLLHAGVYYVQEAGSMFLDEVLRTLSGSLPTGEGGGRGRSVFSTSALLPVESQPFFVPPCQMIVYFIATSLTVEGRIF